ncbi:hypothetical protein E3N88_45030 [Mikania micrantha]|uniref:Uncharacterized protein n=1 Tax=Mikania micrantha TaxID=192012 RepID=A0A5N6LAB3_9ASTR|nr:hypothetical protein E3N88_45030 [Mikania micrantha]
MSRRKKLNIITTESNLAVKDNVTSETQGLHKSEMQGGVSSSQEFQSTNEQGAGRNLTWNRSSDPRSFILAPQEVLLFAGTSERKLTDKV